MEDLDFLPVWLATQFGGYLQLLLWRLSRLPLLLSPLADRRPIRSGCMFLTAARSTSLTWGASS